jgi:hypothetical protein
MIADDLPQAAVSHAMEGRTRLRLAGRSEDAGFFAAMAAGLSAIPGVRKVEVAPLTGGILIRHDVPLSRIAEAAEKGGLFALIDPAIKKEPPTDFALRIDPKFRERALRLGPRMVAAAALGLIAAWQMYKEKFFPSGITAAWYAASLAGLLSTVDGADIEDGG